MQTYIALLRGINVSGQKKIKMADLRAELAELNFKNLNTYVQSGNIVFQAEATAHEVLEQAIATRIQEQYGFDVPVLVKTAAEWTVIVDDNPFPETEGYDLKQLYVTLWAAIPTTTTVEKLQSLDYSPEQFKLQSKTIYLYVPKGYGRAKLNNNFFEQKLKVTATTRNWRTVNKLLEMAQEL